MEFRKYYTQMSQEEIEVLSNRIDGKQFEFTPYSYGRMIERNMNTRMVFDAINYGSIIEYHHINGVNRVLLRGVSTYDGARQACVVVDINEMKIITCYVNKSFYHHRNLDMSQYDASLDLRALA